MGDSCEPTYMGLKLGILVHEMIMADLLRAYLYGIETPHIPSASFPERFRCEPTYMGLKRGKIAKNGLVKGSCEPTYMGLKLPFGAYSL